jgi:hypothetical protein
VTRQASWLLAALVVSGLVGGCSNEPAAAPAVPAAPAPALPSAPALPTAAGPDQAACADYANTVNTVRGIASALQNGPVLPAGVALFLLDARTRASAPGASDPALAAAQAELVAAIDDLDAQGRDLLPAGGNPARDAVQLDPTRILAAVGTIERLCGG